MATIQTLIDLAQMQLSDSGAATWAEADLLKWVGEAIMDYSVHFPLKSTQDITTVADQHDYDLDRSFLNVISVEYPAGQDPPEYLAPMSRRDARFWADDCYYDIETSGAITESVLWISADPAADETITVYYQATQAEGPISGNPTATLTMPERHYHLIVSFVYWCAMKERLAAQMQAPDTTINLIDNMAKTAKEAEAEYRRLVASALAALVETGYTRPWSADQFDRIY